jgi:hypothetical protein
VAQQWQGVTVACFLPGTGTLAIIAFSAYLIWHKAIGHFLAIAGVVAGPLLVAGAAAAAAGLVIWTARLIRRRRARAGACTTCRLGCQQSLPGHRHLLVNRADRRLAAPARVPAPARVVPAPARVVPAPARVVPAPARRPAPAAAASPPASRGRERWPLAGAPVSFGRYALTPGGAGRAAEPDQASESTRANASR